MTWIRRNKQKKLISKISADSNSTFSSYAWLCVFHCFHRLLCWIKSRTQNFLWKLLSFHTEMISAWFLWRSVLLRGELQKYAKNSHFENFESALYSISGSMPLKDQTQEIAELWGTWHAEWGRVLIQSKLLKNWSPDPWPLGCIFGQGALFEDALLIAII